METKKENEVMHILLQIPEIIAECEMLRLLPFRWASKKPRTSIDCRPRRTFALLITPNCSPKTPLSFSNMVLKFKIKPNAAHPQIQSQNRNSLGLDFKLKVGAKRKRKNDDDKNKIKNVVVDLPDLNIPQTPCEEEEGQNIEKADRVTVVSKSEMASEARKRRMQIVRGRRRRNNRNVVARSKSARGAQKVVTTTTVVQVVPTFSFVSSVSNMRDSPCAVI